MFSDYYPIEDRAQAQIRALHQQAAQERLIRSFAQPFHKKARLWITKRLAQWVEPRRELAAQRL